MYCGSNNNRDSLTPLRRWTEDDSKKVRQALGWGAAEYTQNLLRKTAVAYGIGELLRRVRASMVLLDEQLNIDNFVVRTNGDGLSSRPSWRDIKGVDMLSPKLSVNIVEPSFLRGCFQEGNGDDQEEMGGYLEVEIPSHPDADVAAIFISQREEDRRCHLFGVLLNELFSHRPTISAEDTHNEGGTDPISKNGDAQREPARKRTQLVDLRAAGVTGIRSITHVHDGARREKSSSALQRGGYPVSLEEGLPSSIQIVIQNLLECGEDDRPDNAYDSLDEVIKDLHLMLLDPIRFLGDKEPIYDELGNLPLSFREHKLYGRENEVSLITEAFCRVSSGKSESFFIGGFSGSGKSRLVNDLTARVDVVGGYVLSHKFDQMSQEKSMLEVVATFNDLCQLIQDKNSQQDLLVIVNDLVRVFGADLSTLAQLLPNIKALAPHLKSSDDEQDIDNQMNVQGICFILQQFIRVVSSVTHPVMLFLDDLQWCDKSALTVVESLLCDEVGSNCCLFFVGTYRSNEVAEDHEIFCLAHRLRSFGVPTTMLSLEGLNPKDLNAMISDALCMFPRISEPLSDIIYQKTKGNPFFVLAFMRSLVDRGLLEYSINTRRWVWDEDDVSSMDVTGNILYLLSSKMSGLSTNIQSALKVAACFGIKIKESVVATLDTEHSDLRDKLEQVVKEGFMVKVGTSDFKFVHDKVREAAYGLIPENQRSQYHYSLGMALYSMTKGNLNLVVDIAFSIADQIKHGIGNLGDENPESRIDIAKLYELAGMQAAANSDHTASRSYLTYALALLPTDHWQSHYDVSLRFSLRLAKSCYSCGDLEKAHSILGETMARCHSIEDKLPSYALLARIHLDRKSFTEAYALCHETLSQLGEEMPKSLQRCQIYEMIEATSKNFESISDSDLLEMKDMDERLGISMHFYGILSIVAFFGKREMLPFVACRMTQLTLESGLCKYSIIGFVLYAMVLCNGDIVKKDIDGASRIGKAAMSCLKKRYHTTEQLPQIYVVYYGFVAPYTEPLLSCADMLRQGFDAGMSLGEAGFAFLNSTCHIWTAMVAGNRLPTVLEKVDYYLKLANTYQNEITKTFHSINRETISILIDNGGSSSSSPFAIDVPTNTEDTNVLGSIYCNRAIQAYWQGYSERCQHYIRKFHLLPCPCPVSWRLHIITFIEGMNSFQLLKRTSNGRLRSIPRNAILVLKSAASLSSWNWRNKVHLLEAEQFSFLNRNSEAQSSYAAAINSARSSGFIHEQGLSCELAGYHFKKVFDLRSAWISFDRAKQCYEEWGSEMKVDSVSRQLRSLSDYMPGGPSSSSSSALGSAAGDPARIKTHLPSSKKNGVGGSGCVGMDDKMA